MKKQFGFKEKVLTIILGILLIVGGSLTFLLSKGTSYYRNAKKETIALGEKYGKLKKTEDFYYFNGEKTYFSVKGKNQQNEITYVLIPKDGKEVTVLKEKEGVSDNTILKEVAKKKDIKNIEKIALGIKDKNIVWEVTARNQKNQLRYFYFNYKDGKEIKEIASI